MYVGMYSTLCGVLHHRSCTVMTCIFIYSMLIALLSICFLSEVQLFAVSKGFTDLSDKMVEFRQLFEKEIVKHKSQRRY